MKTYFTADLHYGDNRFHLFPRPFKTVEEAIKKTEENWNRVVKPEDRVYVIGDVALDEKYLDRVDDLNGQKVLITGNYDTLPKATYLRYFTRVYDSLSGPAYMLKTGDGVQFLLNHYPTKGRKEYFNLVGHVHGAWRVQKNMINVGLDAWNYTPVSLEQILQFKTFVEKYADEDVWVAYHESNTVHMERGRKGQQAKGTAKK
jgi:calcineurin-like phosphoesterase family protein